MKKTTILAILTVLLTFSTATANSGHGLGFGSFGDFGGFFGGVGPDEHHHGFSGFGGDLGLAFFDPERAQDFFETRFDRLQTQYDEGVASGNDFFTSTEYDRIVDKTELLTDRYGLFVGGVERNIDRLTDVISIANDDLTFYNDLLADYQADTTLSAERLARIEQWITRVTDRISGRIDSLTDKQSTLQTNLPTYQSFQTELSTFLADITAAGTTTTGSTTSSSLALTSAASISGGSAGESTSTELTAGAVPEPSAAMLVGLAFGAGSFWSARRRQRAGRTRP